MCNASRYPNLLVPDVWLRIADLSSKRSLNSLCRTSHHFLDLLRPRLYREVYLSMIEPFLGGFDKYSVALKLLASDPELARYVQEFHVQGPYQVNCERESIPEYYLGAIRNMSSLKSLAVTGSIVRDASEQKLLVDTLSKLDPPLMEFYFKDKAYTWSIPGADFPLSSLTKLGWVIQYMDCGYFPPMFSMLAASRETIETLILKFELEDSNPFQRLWDLRFPRLQSLTIGFKDRPLIASAFTQFLLAHERTLAELDLTHEYATYFEYGAAFKRNLRPSSFPNLTTFRGHANTFLEMVDARMGCLRLLRTLDLRSGSQWSSSTSEFHGMFDGLDRWREDEDGKAAAAEKGVGDDDGESDREERVPILRSLTCLHLNDIKPSTKDILQVMERCAEHFGKTIEVLAEGVNFPIEREEILPVFGKFDRLKHIYLNHLAFWGHGMGESYALALAARIPSLEEVTFTHPFKQVRIKRDGSIPRVEGLGTKYHLAGKIGVL